MDGGQASVVRLTKPVRNDKRGSPTLQASIRYLATALATLLGASVLAFSVLHLAPMDPARYFVQFRFQQTRPGVREEQIRALADWYGLQDPIVVQYARWLGRAATGNFGRSLTTGREVGPELARRLPWTVVLTIPVLVAAWVGAILLAAVAAGGGRIARVAGALITAGALTPVFLLASLLVYVFAVRLTWIPILPPFELNLLDTYLWRAMLLPVVSLVLPIGAIMARRISADVRASLKAPHVTAARARGTAERGVLWRHALRAGIRPLLARPLGTLSVLFGGVLVAEDIFGWPGIGRVFMRAIAARDITAMQASLLLLAALVLAAECIIRILGSRQSPEDSVAAAPSLRVPGHPAPIPSSGLALRVAIGVASLIVVMAVAAPLLARFPPDLVQLEEIQVGPSLRHWMGTDASGRDMFSRLLFASRVTLALALLSALAAVAVAGLLAGLAAWRGHSWADVAVGTARTVLAIPALAVALCVISVGGRAPVLIGGMFAFCGLPYVATRLRVLFASALRWPFVDAARLVGASPVRIGERHLFPHLARPLLAAAVGLLPLFLMLEATLGFFGFSLTPTIPTWGTLLWRGREALHRGDWWLLGFPMMFVAATAWASMRIAAALGDPLPPTYVVTRKLVLGREWGDAATQTTVSRGRGPVPAAVRSRARPAPASAAAQGGAGNGASGDGSSG